MKSKKKLVVIMIVVCAVAVMVGIIIKINNKEQTKMILSYTHYTKYGSSVKLSEEFINSFVKKIDGLEVKTGQELFLNDYIVDINDDIEKRYVIDVIKAICVGTESVSSERRELEEEGSSVSFVAERDIRLEAKYSEKENNLYVTGYGKPGGVELKVVIGRVKSSSTSID